MANRPNTKTATVTRNVTLAIFALTHDLATAHAELELHAGAYFFTVIFIIPPQSFFSYKYSYFVTLSY